MIGIIFISDIIYCPYLEKYTKILESLDKDFEVLFWNREKKNIDYPSNYIFYDHESEKNRLPIFKIFDFLKYRKWLVKRLKNKRYKKLIILSTLSGMIISDVLHKHFKRRYIFDIRDYSYENNILFYNIEERIIRESFFTCISSKGFKEFLLKGYDYLTVHNFNKNEIQNNKLFKKKKIGETLRLVFIGGVRYFGHQRKIIDKLKDDSRFEMVYHGSGIELDRFISYCKNNHIKNVVFTGEYNNRDKNRLLRDADILNNSYKTDKVMEVKYAISNKYYDGLIFYIPQLVETETFKTDTVEMLGVGIGLDPDDKDFADKLYNYYFNIDAEAFNESCKRELKKTLFEDKEYTKKIEAFLNC